MGRVFYTDLPAHLRFTLLALADHADDDGSNVYPGQERIARKVGAGIRAVRDHLHELVRLGYLAPETRKGQRGTVCYRIAVDQLPTDAALDRQPTAARQKLPPGNPAPVATLSTGNPASLDRQPTADNPSRTVRREKQPSVLRSEFEVFWTDYPPRDGRREKKIEAWEQWQKLRPPPQLQATMRGALLRYGQSTDKPVDAVRWLKRRRWEDEEIHAATSAAKVSQIAADWRASVAAAGGTT